MNGAAHWVDNCKQHLDFFKKAIVRPRTRADYSHPRGNEAHGGKGRSWVSITIVVNTTSTAKDQQSQVT